MTIKEIFQKIISAAPDDSWFEGDYRKPQHLGGNPFLEEGGDPFFDPNTQANGYEGFEAIRISKTFVLLVRHAQWNTPMLFKQVKNIDGYIAFVPHRRCGETCKKAIDDFLAAP